MRRRRVEPTARRANRTKRHITSWQQNPNGASDSSNTGAAAVAAAAGDASDPSVSAHESEDAALPSPKQ